MLHIKMFLLRPGNEVREPFREGKWKRLRAGWLHLYTNVCISDMGNFAKGMSSFLFCSWDQRDRD